MIACDPRVGEYLAGKQDRIGAAHEAAERPPIRPVGRLAEPLERFSQSPLLGANVSSTRYCICSFECHMNPCPVSAFYAHIFSSDTSEHSGKTSHSGRLSVISRSTSICCFFDLYEYHVCLPILCHHLQHIRSE